MKETSGESDQICEAKVVSSSSMDLAYLAMLRRISSASESGESEIEGGFGWGSLFLVVLAKTAELRAIVISAIERTRPGLRMFARMGSILSSGFCGAVVAVLCGRQSQ